MMFRGKVAAFSLIALLLSACQAPTPGPHATSSSAGPIDHADPNDPCAVNLEGMASALLLYYAQYHTLPETLEKLPPKTIEGDTLQLTCPVSGKRYVYYPEGYQGPPGVLISHMKLILYDAEASHLATRRVADGLLEREVQEKIRYGIIMAPLQPGRAPELSVIPLDDNLFNLYLHGSK